MFNQYSQYYKQRGKFFLKAFILALLLGFASGIAGGIVGSSLYTEQIIHQQPNLPHISIEPNKEKTLDRSQVQTIQQGMVGLYLQKTQGTTITSSIYTDVDLLGYAGVITSDGVIVTSADILTSGNTYIAISAGMKRFSVENITSDDATGLAFATLTSLSDGESVALTPLTLADASDDVKQGETVYTFDGEGNVAIGYIQDPKHLEVSRNGDFIVSSDVYAYRIDVDQLQKGKTQLLFNDDFVLIGILDDAFEDTRFIPVHVAKQAIASVLKGQSLNRFVLGASYLDLSQVVVSDETLLTRGAYITGDRFTGKVAISQGSVASAIGLRAFDVITHVNGMILNAQMTLTDVLLELSNNDTVTFLVNRDGEELELIYTPES